MPIASGGSIHGFKIKSCFNLILIDHFSHRFNINKLEDSTGGKPVIVPNSVITA